MASTDRLPEADLAGRTERKCFPALRPARVGPGGRHGRRRGVSAWLALGLAVAAAWPLQGAPPLVQSHYLNPLYPEADTNGVALVTNYAWFAALDGFTSTNTSGPSAPGLRIANSAFGHPIVGVGADFELGDMLTPPDEVDLTVAPVLDFLGGPQCAVWLDYAQVLIASDMGVVQVIWTLAGGGTQTITYTLSPNPTKRPVRLYWTEGQNAGPRIALGSNYRVDIHVNSQITEISTNQVWISDNMLRAQQGVKGRFLLTYSRLDEQTGKRKLLAYEIVEVLEPMSALLRANVGARLLPQSRPYATEDLYAEVVRGAVDPSGQDTPFVYLHSEGTKKGWVWAVRETEAPWQIEIYWKAKEELDVLWPFEVDIYDVTWGANAQLYARADLAAGDMAPKVYFPDELVIDIMPHQVPENHAVLANGVFHTTAEGYCLLKYLQGKEVWFEPVRSVSYLNPLFDRTAVGWTIARELRPVEPGTRVSQEATHGEWPGYLYTPVGTAYNVDRYAYPAGYVAPEAAASYVFAVNVGDLEVWWSNASVQEGLPSPVFFPSLINRYTCDWAVRTEQIVIASGLGSQGLTLNETETGCVRFDRAGLSFEQAQVFVSHLALELPNNLSIAKQLTLEMWVYPRTLSGLQYLVDKDGNYRLRLNGGEPQLLAGGRWYGAGRTLTAGQWQHLAVTVADRDKVIFYLDGEEIAAVACDGWLTHSAAPLRLGARAEDPLAPEDFFNGSLDEIRIWAVRRTRNQIRDHMVVTVPAGTAGLRAYYRFEDDDLALEGIASDSSYFRNHITLPPRGVAFERPGIKQVELGADLSGVTARLYVQNEREQDGFNPNEEHAILIQNTAYALRCDLNKTNAILAGYTSLPYVLLDCESAYVNQGRPYMLAFQVVASNKLYQFERFWTAGLMIQPPAPIALLPPPCAANEQVAGPRYRDRKGYYWAKQAGNDGGTTNYVFDFYYPMQSEFFFPDLAEQPPLGTQIPWLDVLAGDGTPLNFTYVVEWPEDVPRLYIGDTLTNAKNGLPAIRGQLSVDVAYQQSLARNAAKPSVVLIDPTVARPAPLETIPPGMKSYRDVRTACWYFSDLPPALRARLFFNPNAPVDQELQIIGQYFERTDGYNYLMLNLLAGENLAASLDETLVTGISGSAGDPWRDAIATLPGTPVVLTDDVTPFDSLALSTAGLGTGYVSVVFNNSVNTLMVDPSENIDMVVFRVEAPLFVGRLDIVQSKNPLDKQISVYYTADFQGVPERYEFKWEWADPLDGRAPSEWETSLWHDYVTGEGRHYVTIGDAGVFGLSDHYVRCSYRALDANVQSIAGTDWSAWTPPVLCEGWIKRVLKAVNPFEQRIRDFMNYAILTDLSMLQQIGAPYNGDIPLNYEALNEYGLMQIYETINRQADSLSIDSDFVASDGLALALLMVKGRLSDLYTVLGHEAYGDAANPTILLGPDDPTQNDIVTAGDWPSMFCFENQVPTLLDEELALLRGRDGSMNPPVTTYPVYNRLVWNITADIVGGQVAYMLNYGISDLKGNQNGVLDAEDAATLFPQGHGDAYGHYLSALMGYYTYLHHPNFAWYPGVEGILVSDLEVTVSYLHEKRFATAAAARARAGADIVNRTWRAKYTETDGWRAARDTNTGRAWGVGEWGARAGMGAYFDWLTANSLLPAKDPDTKHEGIRVIDRENMPELAEIADQALRIQRETDNADANLNPMGVTPDAVPFDISSAAIDEGQTHFEQIYARALAALQTAASVASRVRNCAQAIRQQNEERDLDQTIVEEEMAIDHELTALYGYPYQDDIGPGKTYPQGYNGPDMLHYMYVDTWPLDPTILTDQRTLDLTWTAYSYSIRTNVADLSSSQWLSQIFGSDVVKSYDIVSAYYDSSNVYTMQLNVAGNGIPVKPSTWTGKRRAEGEIQIALSEYLTAVDNLFSAVGDAQLISDELKRKGDAWLVKLAYMVEKLDTTMDANTKIRAIKVVVAALQGVLDLNEAIDDMTSQITEASIEAMPKVVGLDNDVTAPARSVMKFTYSTVSIGKLIAGIAIKASMAALESGVTDIEYALERELASLDIQEEGREVGFEVLGQLQQQVNSLSTVQGALQTAETARMQLMAKIGDGDRLQMRRERLRMNWASDLNTRRYRNMAYRLFANDELQRYEQTFNNAARYVYLAAKAYDYETGLLPADGEQSAGRAFMRQIVKSRSLGRFSDWTTTIVGDPLPGGAIGDPGLADVMARMKGNWDVLKGRLSFNNPQTETGRISLRTELFRISPAESSDASWAAVLAAHKVANLRALPEFNRYCQPFDPIRDVEPAIVIPFSTAVNFRQNVFGRVLAAGDNAYDSTHFATKVRSAGVWFANYNNAFDAGLATQPRIYLIPVGRDCMRVPLGESSTVRRWDVVDQAMPLPYPISGTEWETPDWSVLGSLLGNQFYRIRRYPAMLAYHDGGEEDPLLEVSWNSRLVGRSVWNTRWLLIIPGGTLLSDGDEGIARFIYGQTTPQGGRDGNGVKDIKLYFHTYSYSGN